MSTSRLHFSTLSRPSARPGLLSVLVVLFSLGCGSGDPGSGSSTASQPDPSSPSESAARPDSADVKFVRISEFIPEVQLDVRYITDNNFIGRPITGYRAAECMLVRQAAEALAEAQRLASERGYALKLYDCFRPQRAVDDFVSWGRDLEDVRMKSRFYPDVPKAELFDRGYIASRSGHSRGSTVDLTIVPIGSDQPPAPASGESYDCRAADPAGRYPDNSLDMGTGYDCFDALSHTENPAIGDGAMANRMTLKSIMESAGFVNYNREWWHYTLADEPYPDTFFDIPVE